MKRKLYCVIEVDEADPSYSLCDYATAFHMMLSRTDRKGDAWLLDDVTVYDDLQLLNHEWLLPNTLT